MPFATALGVNYGNDLNPYNGRYQAIYTQWHTVTTNATTGTPDTTEILFQPCGLQAAQILEVLIHYGAAASGAISTPAQWWLYKYLVNNATPELQGSSLVIATEANQTIRTVREFSTAYAKTTSNTSEDRYTYPTFALGEVPRLLLKVVGVGGTQTAITFGIRYRERPVYLDGPTVATAGSVADRVWP